MNLLAVTASNYFAFKRPREHEREHDHERLSALADDLRCLVDWLLQAEQLGLLDPLQSQAHSRSHSRSQPPRTAR